MRGWSTLLDLFTPYSISHLLQPAPVSNDVGAARVWFEVLQEPDLVTKRATEHLPRASPYGALQTPRSARTPTRGLTGAAIPSRYPLRPAQHPATEFNLWMPCAPRHGVHPDKGSAKAVKGSSGSTAP